MTQHIRNFVGIGSFVGFLACIPAANWMIHNVGTVCLPHGPCLVPVAPGIMAPSGVTAIGFALVIRDVVQRCLGVGAGLFAIAVGSAASVMVAPPSLVAASGIAFLLSEIADLAVYTPLQRRRLLAAVIASSVVGLVVDSVVFLLIAFGSLSFLPGQIIGKLWAVLAATPAIVLLRRTVPART